MESSSHIISHPYKRIGMTLRSQKYMSWREGLVCPGKHRYCQRQKRLPGLGNVLSNIICWCTCVDSTERNPLWTQIRETQQCHLLSRDVSCYYIYERCVTVRGIKWGKHSLTILCNLLPEYIDSCFKCPICDLKSRESLLSMVVLSITLRLCYWFLT